MSVKCLQENCQTVVTNYNSYKLRKKIYVYKKLSKIQKCVFSSYELK